MGVGEILFDSVQWSSFDGALEAGVGRPEDVLAEQARRSDAGFVALGDRMLDCLKVVRTLWLTQEQGPAASTGEGSQTALAEIPDRDVRSVTLEKYSVH